MPYITEIDAYECESCGNLLGGHFPWCDTLGSWSDEWVDEHDALQLELNLLS